MSDVPSGAVQVVRDFLDAAQRKDMEGMKVCLTRKTLESGQFNGSGPDGFRPEIGEAHMEGDLAVVNVGTYPIDAPAGSAPVMEMACIVVQEEGAWKFDLATTMERMMSGMLGAAMEQVAGGLNDAMSQVGQALGDAFGESTLGRGEKDPAWEHASLTPEADELFPLPDMRRLPQTTLLATHALGFDVPVEMDLGEMIAHMAPAEAADMVDQMANWFDGSFFSGWQAVFDAVAASGVPGRDRLRAIRIETIDRCENRIVVLDGNDLVYRLNPTRSEGYLGDDVLSGLLPGVLAGLPERIDSSVEGKRTLPLESERPTVASYRERWVPRWMRRIGTLLGKPIGLKVDWERAADATNTGPQLPRWGLNRVYGALALACMDAVQKTTLQRDLHTIEIDAGSSVYKRYAKYEDGKLSVGLCYLGGDTPGCYEHEIAGALAGRPVE